MRISGRLASSPLDDPPAATDLALARELVMRYGEDAWAYQILNPGLGLWFSRNRQAVAGYLDWGRVRVVAGGPVARPGSRRAAALELEQEAALAGLGVCYFGVDAGPGEIPGSGSGQSVELGAQPVWHPAAWPGLLGGHPSLRAQLHRARNKGVRVREWATGLAAGNPELAQCMREWLEGRPMPAMHFLVEPDILSRLWDRRLFVAKRDGQPVGYLVASPVPRRRGWLIEQIIRGRAAPNGTAELLLDAAFRAAAAEGLEYFTLGLAPLSRHAGPGGEDAPAWLRGAFRWARAHGSRFYDFQGLDAFKAKFGPREWQSVYAICTESRFTPGMLLAILAVFAGRAPLPFLGQALLKAVRQEIAWMGRKIPGYRGHG